MSADKNQKPFRAKMKSRFAALLAGTLQPHRPGSRLVCPYRCERPLYRGCWGAKVARPYTVASLPSCVSLRFSPLGGSHAAWHGDSTRSRPVISHRCQHTMLAFRITSCVQRWRVSVLWLLEASTFFSPPPKTTAVALWEGPSFPYS